MKTIRGYIALFYMFAFCLCMAFICNCNLEYYFGLKRWSLYWFAVLVALMYGWSFLIKYILNDGLNFEYWIISRLKKEKIQPAALQSSEFVEVIKNWMPVLIFGGTWYLEKKYGSNISSIILFAIGLLTVGYFAFREKNWKGQIPAWLIFLASLLITDSMDAEWSKKIQGSIIYPIRVVSLLAAVIGLQAKKPYFLKILGTVWFGQAVLFMLLAFCVGGGMSELGIKGPAGEKLELTKVYAGFLLLSVVFGFPFALKTAFVGTVKMGIAESFIADVLDSLKVVAGIVVLSMGATGALNFKNHITLLVPITAILALYFGDVLDKKVLEEYD
jgi:hypothetical protein